MRFDRDAGEDARIAQALRSAGLWDVVEALPDGLDTVVGAGFGGATDLSGGQWQRLALARLLYHDAPLIILEEPRARLDPIGERQIFALLSTLARDHQKIVLFTTHRYDTIRRADTIVVLWMGRSPRSARTTNWSRRPARSGRSTSARARGPAPDLCHTGAWGMAATVRSAPCRCLCVTGRTPRVPSSAARATECRLQGSVSLPIFGDSGPCGCHATSQGTERL
jgi:ABC transporter family protein